MEYGNPLADVPVVRFAPARAGGPTEKQIAFFNRLLDEKQLTDDERESLVTEARSATKRRISELIDSLLGKPNKQVQQQQDFPDVPDGRYAIETDEGLKFYIVSTGKNGRWKGFRFVDAQGGPQRYPIRDRQRKAEILAEIAENPIPAAQRYGQELGHCGVCGLQLTDEESRALGIGPVCRDNWGI